VFACFERHAEESDIRFQRWRRLPVLESTPAAIERRLHKENAFLVEAHGADDSVLTKGGEIESRVPSHRDYISKRGL
jgi:hypothetical protein